MLGFATFWGLVVIVGSNGFTGRSGEIMVFGNLGIAWLALLLAPWLSWKTPYWLRHSQLAPWLVLLIAGIAVPMFSAFLVMGCFFVTAVVMT